MLECESTPTQLAMSRAAQDCRRRLRTPPNAVQDTPISLKKPSAGVTGLESQRIAREAAIRAEEVAKREILERQIEDLQAEIIRLSNIKVENARDWLMITDHNKYPVNYISHIKQAVAKHFQVETRSLASARRTNYLIIPRHIAIYLVRELLPHKSSPEIGRMFGKRDHSTILHAIKQTKARMAADSGLYQQVCELRGKLETDLAKWRVGV